MLKAISAVVMLMISLVVFGQNVEKRVLFLGNSYTSANNLPQLIADVATSMDDTLVWEKETPGGYFLYDHSVNSSSLNKIAAGNWDYVVLQDQSQATTLPDSQMPLVISSAQKLDSLINKANPCAETMFYMTWGRKNGDPFFYQIYYPWYADSTYEYMDSLIHDRYMQMSVTNKAEVSPVGAVWRYVRENYTGMELYQADGSHPSITGSYLAACCFYTALFRKDPTQITYNSVLPNSEAAIIKNAVKLIVYDSLLNWNIGKYDSLNSVNCGPTTINDMRVSQSSTLQVFPNPSTGKINIVCGAANVRVEIYTVLGQQIDHFLSTSREVNYQIKEDGVYMIRVLTEEGIQIQKVVVHRF